MEVVASNLRLTVVDKECSGRRRICEEFMLQTAVNGVSVPPGAAAFQSQINTERLMLIINYLAYRSGLLLTGSYNSN